MKAPPQRIAVRVSNWIGDVVMNLPALEVLRARYPDAEITVIARPPLGDLLAFRPDLVDRLLVCDDREAQRGPLAFWRFCRGLKTERFELGLVFTHHLKGALTMWLAGVPQRVGFATGETRWFLNRSKPRRSQPKSGRHQSHHYLDLLVLADIEIRNRPAPRLSVDDALNREVAARYLPDAKRPILAVHAGAAYGTAKRWLPERYGEVCRWFLENHGGTVVLLGVAAENDVNQTISRIAGPEGVLNLCGKTRLKESIALISAAELFLSNDSGLMHVAAAFGVPQVALFGPTDVHATFPKNPKAQTLRHPVPCSPCFLRHCPIGHDCMVGLESNRVIAALEAALQHSRI